MLHKVKIAGLTMDEVSGTPIIILQTEDQDARTVPIWIGLLEATAIASTLKDIQFDRPMTHDLFKNFSEYLNYHVSKVEICDIRDNTYYARIYFFSPEQSFDIDARPSDAIAIALRFNAQIYVDTKVFEKSQTPANEKTEALDKSKEGQKWAEYLEKMAPDDFGKYKM